MELGWDVAGGVRRDEVRPADDGADPDASLQQVALDPVEGAEGVEEIRLEGLLQVGFLAGAVVGGEDDEGVAVDPEILKRLDDIADAIVDAADAGGVALVNVRPCDLRGRGILVRVPCGGCVVRMEPGIGFSVGGVDHATLFAEPLDPSF